MKKIWLVILLLATLVQVSYSQKKKKETREEKRERKEKERLQKRYENIDTFPKNFLFRPKFIYPTVIVNVSNRDNNGQSFDWQPSMPGLVGASIRIKKVYASAVFKLPPSSSQIAKYGNTKFRDIYVNIEGRIVQWTMFYRDYKGYYLDNYQKFYPNWDRENNGYPKANSLRIIEGGLNVGFNFNKKFSLNAAFTQTERQKKGAGSFLMNISERYQHLETDTNIVPFSELDHYPNLYRLQNGDFYTTLLGFGSGYQFVYKKFHITPVILLGTGVQFQNYFLQNEHKFRVNIPTYVNGRAQMGYNGDNFFVNLIYGIEFNSIPIRETLIRLYRQSIEFGAGVRF